MNQNTRVSNRNVYLSHHLADPSYPKTIITPNGVNDYTIHYAHGKALSEFDINTCPDSVFNYDSQYFQSLLSLKNTYLSNIEKVRYQLEAFDASLMDKFIDSKIDDKYLRYSSNVRKSIDKLSSITAEDIIRDTSTDLEAVSLHDLDSISESMKSELEEYKSAYDSIEDIVYDELYDEWFRLHKTTPDSEQYCKDILGKWEMGLMNLDNEFRAWKEDALREAIEYEKTQILEYQSIPHTCKEFKLQLQKIYRTDISKLAQDVKNSVLDIVITKLPSSAVTKYEDQLTSLIMLHSKCKCYKHIDAYMETVKNKVSIIINRLKITEFNQAADYYEIKKYLFPIIIKSIEDSTRVLFTEINDRLKNIQQITDTVTNMQIMKRIATRIINDINTQLNDMDIIINEISESDFFSIINAVKLLNETYLIKIPTKNDEDN